MLAWLKKVLGFLGQLLVAIAHFVFESFTHYDEVVADVNHIVDTWSAIKLNIETEVGKIREFKFDPHWKTRVINVPQAAEQIQELKAMLFDDWKGRVDKVVAPVHELTQVLRQERAPDVGDPQGAVNAMSKASVKLGHVVTMIHQVRDALDEVQSFVELFDELRQNLESLDSIFLPQGSSKTTVTETYRKRNA
jgi:hypothetical protein